MGARPATGGSTSRWSRRTAELNFLWGALIAGVAAAGSAHSWRSGSPAGRAEPGAGNPRARVRRGPPPFNTSRSVTDRAAGPCRLRRSTSPCSTNSPTSSSTGPETARLLAALSNRSCCCSALFGIATACPRALPVGVRSSDARGAQLRRRGARRRASTSATQPSSRLFALSAGIAGFGGVFFGVVNFVDHQLDGPASARPLLDRARRDVRHPPPRRRAARRSRVRVRAADLPLDRRATSCRAGHRRTSLAPPTSRPSSSGSAPSTWRRNPTACSRSRAASAARRSWPGSASGPVRSASPKPKQQSTAGPFPSTSDHAGEATAAPDRRSTTVRACIQRGRARAASASSPDTARSRCSTASTLRIPTRPLVALARRERRGKSTLCSVAAGLVRPTEGASCSSGEDVTDDPPYRRNASGAPARSRGPWHLPRADGRGEPHRCSSPRRQRARTRLRTVPGAR